MLRTPSYYLPGDFSCAPDGTVLCPWDYNYGVATSSFQLNWRPDLFLSITLAFGNFSFSAAKAIDVCWDVMAGRGGQLVLVLISYPVLRRSLNLSMEQTTISFRLFAVAAFEKVSLRTLWTATRSIFVPRTGLEQPQDLPLRTHRQIRRRLAAFAFACAYILVFPVMMSTMSGYQVGLSPYIKSSDSNVTFPPSALFIPHWILQDGHRIGLSEDYPVRAHDEVLGLCTSCYLGIQSNE